MDQRFRLGRLLDLCVEKLELGKGEIRLVGWTGQQVAQAVIKPAATQTDQKTLVLVHLQRPKLPKMQRESGVFFDYSKFDFDDFFDEDKKQEEKNQGNNQLNKNSDADNNGEPE